MEEANPLLLKHKPIPLKKKTFPSLIFALLALLLFIHARMTLARPKVILVDPENVLKTMVDFEKLADENHNSRSGTILP